MISKSLSLPSSNPDSSRVNKTLDFAHFYKTATESSTTLKKDLNTNNNNDSNETSLARQSHNKNGKGQKVSVTKIDIDGKNLGSKLRHGSPNGSKITSTPNMTIKRNLNIKPIIKESPTLENSLDLSNVPKLNRKKRNKSVSFMVEENDDVVVKKTKSDESLLQKTEEKKPKMKNKRFKKIQKEDKENDTNPFINDMQNLVSKTEINKKKALLKKNKKVKPESNINDKDINVVDISTSTISKDNISGSNCNMTGIDLPTLEKSDTKKKRRKHGKALKSVEKENPTDTGAKNVKQNDNAAISLKRSKRSRKNKHIETSEVGEPEKKNIKKSKPDNIAHGIENLSIGDNAHTLTNLLDEMIVTKTKKKNNKKANIEISSDKKSDSKPKNNRNSRKRKNRKMHAGVIVQNLPFRILLTYKQKLRDFFSKYGTVQSIGLADLKCGAEEAQPIFTTRIFFTTEKEATAALDGDNELYEGNIIRVKKLSAQVTRIFKPSNKNSTQKDEAKGKTVKEDLAMDNQSD
ncbi:putative uncharacterized protein DDB_G0293878 [Pieris brassicae]|uniref:RRM domain-containing protein n=1 Tax=Pieris brassicae TaxID=7116 RepID=A0A9P0XHK3_PIEBR|nr:putative uncharacterized protein DDB_G0293878 [Pieris brassicae]CAH4035236.1 unnamed protein product [Pieris brassicae]